ncbi:hypothetical protein BVRB_7g161180 [Beta vulgaris subsp. vulgaris]|nr:hypothetical protein BVRB_7g161180 [Beta vulgaris subsp. vulgaris]
MGSAQEKDYVSGANDHKEARGFCAMENMGSHDCPSRKGHNTFIEVREVVKRETIKSGENILNLKNFNMAESKYRFANRKGLGSFLPISRKDYQVLMKGRSIHFVNSKSGSMMTVRVIISSKVVAKSKESDENKSVVKSPMSDDLERNQVICYCNMEPKAQSKEVPTLEALHALTNNDEVNRVRSNIIGYLCNDFRITKNIKIVSGYARSSRGKQRSRLSITIRIMKTCPRTTKNGGRRTSSRNKNTVSSTSNCASKYKLVSDKKRKDFIHSSNIYYVPRKKRQLNNGCHICN